MSYSLPLFPLHVVVCPGGLLPLKIFEARYLDMVKNCLRNKTSFAIVSILPEGATDLEGNFPFANVGTLMDIVDANVDTVGMMLIRCVGQLRVKVESYNQQNDGLIIGQVTDIPNDLQVDLPDDLKFSGEILRQLLKALVLRDTHPDRLPLKPYKLNDVGWVANRWVELIDLSLLEKQRLMQLDSPIVRLELLQDFLSVGNKRTI